VEVAAGSITKLYILQDVLNLLPDQSDSSTMKSFASSMNDQMLIVYLSSLLWAVIALHVLVDNKTSIGKAKIEESESEKMKKEEKEKEKSETKDLEKSNAYSKRASQ
jgi:26S proteasome regulatory subunit N8